MKILWIVVLSGGVIAPLVLFGIALFIFTGGLSYLAPNFLGTRSGALLFTGMFSFLSLLLVFRTYSHYKRYVADR